MKFKPLQDRVLVKRLESETKSAGGIIIPDNAQEKPTQAEVVAVGNGKRLSNGELHTPDVKVGDKVVFSTYAGSSLKIDGDELLVLKEDDIFGVVE
ncbi:MAG: co-chaperone GroES [Proteobacteria bacterium]|nr:co-chaperone GroES [Pseudomonadota bacterium]